MVGGSILTPVEFATTGISMTCAFGTGAAGVCGMTTVAAGPFVTASVSAARCKTARHMAKNMEQIRHRCRHDGSENGLERICWTTPAARQIPNDQTIWQHCHETSPPLAAHTMTRPERKRPAAHIRLLSACGDYTRVPAKTPGSVFCATRSSPTLCTLHPIAQAEAPRACRCRGQFRSERSTVR